MSAGCDFLSCALFVKPLGGVIQVPDKADKQIGALWRAIDHNYTGTLLAGHGYLCNTANKADPCAGAMQGQRLRRCPSIDPVLCYSAATVTVDRLSAALSFAALMIARYMFPGLAMDAINTPRIVSRLCMSGYHVHGGDFTCVRLRIVLGPGHHWQRWR